MNHLTPKDELDRQFGSLIAHIDAWTSRSPAKGDQPDVERTHALLTDFTGFFTDYHAYFVQRLEDGNFDDQRSPEEVLRKVVRHVFEQGATLSRLLSQRRYGSLYRDRLIEADKQAKMYYDRYHGAKPGRNEPLTYFEKLSDITRFPFRPPPLIAVPFVDWNQPQWLALAHELGHHVFWNGADLTVYRQVQDRMRATLDQCLKASPNLKEP